MAPQVLGLAPATLAAMAALKDGRSAGRPVQYPQAPRPWDTYWRDGAACAGTDPDLFFDRPGYEDAAHKRERVAAAKAICAGCPVRAECLNWALAMDADYGIWGGLDEHERRGERRARRRAAG